MPKLLALLSALTAPLLAGCGAVYVEPPAAPSREVPRDVEPRTSPVEQGKTRIILDADGARAQVTDVLASESTVVHADVGGYRGTGYGYSEFTRPVCLTPCIVDLEPGLHTLRFTSESDDRHSEAKIQVGEQSKVVRHAMGSTETHFLPEFGGQLLFALGASALLSGGLVYGLSYATADETGHSTIRSAGLGLAISGAAATAVGGALMLIFRTRIQNGSTTEFLVRNK